MFRAPLPYPPPFLQAARFPVSGAENLTGLTQVNLLDQPSWSGAAGAAGEPLSQEGNPAGRQALCELEAIPEGPAPAE